MIRLWRRFRARRDRPRPERPKRQRPARHRELSRDLAARPDVLRVMRAAALWAIATCVAAASLTAFTESYRGLFEWARHHGLTGLWAYAWPLQVDVFIAVGELALFVALVDGWGLRSRVAAWAVTTVGLAVSVAGNVGHIASHTLTARATAAVPPIAAASALAVGLGVLKRIVEALDAIPAELPEVPSNGVLAQLPKAEAIRLALAHNGGQVLAAQRWLAERGVTADRAYMHDVKRGVRGKGRRHRAPASESAGTGAAA